MKIFTRDWYWYYTTNTILAILIGFPIYMIIITSFTITPELSFNLNSMHNEWTFDNYKNIWELKIRSSRISFNQSFLNSIIVTCGTVILSVIISTLSGYALAILKFPFSELIFILLILPILIPVISLIIPLYKLLRDLNLHDSYTGLILIHTTCMLPVGVFLMRNAFISIPQSLREIAMLEGSSEYEILTKVMFPLALPGVVTVIIFSMYTAWNDYLFSLIFINSPEMQMLNVTLSRLGIRSGNLIFAGYVITYIPFIIFFVLLQRYYIRGIVTSAVKE
jgi:multiple sugar transport system permease protein